MLKIAKRVVKGGKGAKLEFHFPFDWTVLDAIKSISGRKYRVEDKVWELSLNIDNIVKFKKVVKNFGFELDEKALEIVRNFDSKCENGIEDGQDCDNLQEINSLEVPKTINADLRDYQVIGSSFMAQKRRAMNGCEQGLGKTLQAIVAIEMIKGYPAMIVCPASLKYNWCNEYSKFLPSKRVCVLDSKSVINKELINLFDVFIVNYDIIPKKVEAIDKIKLKTIVLDESQYIKNKNTQRYKALRGFKKTIPNRFLLTGTPILSRPSEIINQIDFLGYLDDMGGYYRFATRYCNMKRTRFGMDLSGATNIEELYNKISQLFYYRKNKKDVLRELPDKQYQVIGIDLDNESEYKYAEQNLSGYLKSQIINSEDFLNFIKTVEDKSAIDKYLMYEENRIEGKVNFAYQLMSLNILRKLSAKGKLNKGISWIENFLEAGEKLVVFAHHKEIVRGIANHFKCNYIDGSIASKKRQEYVDDFQNNDKTNIICLNIKAGGVGLTLTASSNVLFIEEPWTPAEKFQAEDRCHRIGQKNCVNIYTMLGVGTIDEDIYSLLESKRKVINSVNAGVFSDEDFQEDSIIQQLIEKRYG